MTIIELCRSILARAEAGEISGIAIATTHPDLCTASAWSMEEATLAELLGSVAILQHRLCHEAADGPDADPTSTGTSTTN